MILAKNLFILPTYIRSLPLSESMVAIGHLQNVLLLSALVLQVTVVFGADSELREHFEIRMRNSINNSITEEPDKTQEKKSKIASAKEVFKNHRTKFIVATGFLLTLGVGYIGKEILFDSSNNDNYFPIANGSNNHDSKPPENDEEWINIMTYVVIAVLIIGLLTIIYCYCRPVEEDEEADMPTNATAAYAEAFGGFKGPAAAPFEAKAHLSAKKAKSKSAGRPVAKTGTAGQSVTPTVANSPTSTG